jgi:hypothetical protein
MAGDRLQEDRFAVSPPPAEEHSPRRGGFTGGLGRRAIRSSAIKEEIKEKSLVSFTCNGYIMTCLGVQCPSLRGQFS